MTGSETKKNTDIMTIIKTSLILFAVTLVAGALLAAANYITAPRIKAIDAETEKNARLEVLPAASSFSDQTSDGEMTRCEGLDAQGSTVGYVFTHTVKSYGGNLKFMCGIGVDGVISGIRVLESNDTAGLGQKATEKDWLAQYIGKGGSGFRFEVVKKGSSPSVPGSGIDAITGATITSDALTKGVNEVLEKYESISGGVK